ncbi:unnamed protein product, partial [Rotaria socialis]
NTWEYHYNLYHTDLMNNDFSRNCIYHAINHQLDLDGKKYETRQLIEYCIRPSSNKEYEDVINGTIYSVLTFDQLKKQNITTESLVDWAIPIDLIERYQHFLDMNNSSSIELFL